MNEKIYIEKRDELPEDIRIDRAIAVCFFEDKIVMVDSCKHGIQFPSLQLELSEAPERTVRREVYGTTGALLRNNALLGLLHVVSRKKKQTIAIYVGDVVCLENTPLIPDNYHRSLMDIEAVYQWLSRSEYESVKDYLLYHAYELFKKIQIAE